MERELTEQNREYHDNAWVEARKALDDARGQSM